MSEKRKLALIGFGYWGKRLRLYLEERFDVVSVFGRSLEKEGIMTDDLDETLRDEIEAVAIATPIGTHYKVARRALETGKHVLCEKPLGQTSDEAEKLMKIASENGLSLVTEYTYTFSEALNMARREIAEGEIGKLLAMELSLRYLGRFLEHDAYWLFATHMLSVLDMFIPIDKLIFRKEQFIPRETGIIRFEGKVNGQIYVSANYPDKEARVILYGSEGTIVYDALNHPSKRLTKYKKMKGMLADNMKGETWKYHSDESNNLSHAINFFADVLDGKLSDQENLGRALRVTEVMERL